MTRSLLSRLIREERGQAIAEYALILAALGIGLFVTIKLLGAAFANGYNRHARGIMRAR